LLAEKDNKNHKACRARLWYPDWFLRPRAASLLKVSFIVREYYNLAHKDYSSEYYINGFENKRIKIHSNLSSFLTVKYRSCIFGSCVRVPSTPIAKERDCARTGTNQTIPANPVSEPC